MILYLICKLGKQEEVINSVEKKMHVFKVAGATEWDKNPFLPVK